MHFWAQNWSIDLWQIDCLIYRYDSMVLIDHIIDWSYNLGEELMIIIFVFYERVIQLESSYKEGIQDKLKPMVENLSDQLWQTSKNSCASIWYVKMTMLSIADFSLFGCCVFCEYLIKFTLQNIAANFFPYKIKTHLENVWNCANTVKSS